MNQLFAHTSTEASSDAMPIFYKQVERNGHCAYQGLQGRWLTRHAFGFRVGDIVEFRAGLHYQSPRLMMSRFVGVTEDGQEAVVGHAYRMGERVSFHYYRIDPQQLSLAFRPQDKDAEVYENPRAFLSWQPHDVGDDAPFTWVAEHPLKGKRFYTDALRRFQFTVLGTALCGGTVLDTPAELLFPGESSPCHLLSDLEFACLVPVS